MTMDKSYFLNNIKQYKQLLLLSCLSLCCYIICSADGINVGSNDNIMCIEQERTALLKFKHGIQIDRCGLLSSWGDHKDNRNCCQWHGVRCSNITGHVIMLNLGGVDTHPSCLEGKMGSSLVDLKHLHYLDLSYNYFHHQPIPNFIGSLVNLKHLNLSNTGLAGEIPPQLGNLSSLTSLDLTSDIDPFYFSDGIYVKNLSWLSRLILLRSIILTNVDLSAVMDWLQIVSNLPFLRVLELENCGLPPLVISPKPLSYQNSTATLSVFNIAQNSLSGSSILFEWLFNLSGINTHLAHVDLSWNQLGGPLPKYFENLQHLSYLDLSYNHFHSLPKTIGNSCSLQELHISTNNLTDELPNIIKTLIGCVPNSLSALDLSNNKIWGSIPDSIEAFSALRDFYLDYNRLNGTVSQRLGQLSEMQNLGFSSNSLEVTLSNIHFSNQSKLKTLYLGNNPALALNISADWIPPFQLDLIDLRNCLLGPLFPKWVLSQKNYLELDISNAGISDSIPKDFWSSLSPKVDLFNLSHNNFYGTIPEIKLTFDPLYDSSTQIDISFNNIEGVIPSFPGHVASLLLNNNKFSNHLPFLCPKSDSLLSYLDLSNNLLSGKLPDCWMKFHQLSILHLENNNFSGVIPPSIGYLKQLQSLHLRNNTICGRMPTLLGSLTSLVVLDLDYNLLSGHIPSSIGNNLKILGIVSLRSNNLEGEVPLSLCQLSSLQILDLSSNHITGTIPKCIYNLTAMHNGTNFMPELDLSHYESMIALPNVDATTIMWKRKEWIFKNFLGLVKAIDLSNNDLEGEIPIEIFDLKGLVSLDLSRNNLIGGISQKFGQLTALEFLDLSHNHLCGVIPASLSNLDFVGVLDLSNNQLSGEIPSVPQLQRFDASTYEGNPQLCGSPLRICPWDQPLNDSPTDEENANHEDESYNGDIFTGICVSVVLGFIVGFWGVCGTLVLKRSWRLTFFGFLDDMKDKFHVMVVVNMDRVRRRK